MVGFHNNVGSATISNWVSPQSQQIAFGRGSLGYVAINNADSAWSATFTTALPDGTYCDVIRGTSDNGSCSGPSWVGFFFSFQGVRTQLIDFAKLYCLFWNVHGYSKSERCYCNTYGGKRNCERKCLGQFCGKRHYNIRGECFCCW